MYDFWLNTELKKLFRIFDGVKNYIKKNYKKSVLTSIGNFLLYKYDKYKNDPKWDTIYNLCAGEGKQHVFIKFINFLLVGEEKENFLRFLDNSIRASFLSLMYLV